MGLQGIQIKSALTQLSHRCQVILERLTEEEINQYSRPKPVDVGLQLSAVASPSHQHNKKIDFKRPKSVSNSHKRQKKKELPRFDENDGEDINKPPVKTKESHEKEVNNYLSTTVHVNYYNYYGTTPSNNTDHKRKSFTDKSVIKSNHVPKKKLRIDVSLSTENVGGVGSDGGLPSEAGSQTTGRNDSSRKKSSCRNKSKKYHQKTHKYSLPRANATFSEEDPSIRELWSILGMESPIDRREKFLSKQFNSSEAIISHGAPEGTSLGENSAIVPQVVDASVQAITTSIDNGNRTSVNQVGLSGTKTQNKCSEIVEPFIKISDTFSLPEISVGECNGISESEANAGKVNAGNVVTQSEETSILPNEGGENNETCTSAANTTDTENDETGVSKHISKISGRISSSDEEPRSKVGTIRVKSLESLVEPQLPSNFIKTSLPNNKAGQSSADVITNCEAFQAAGQKLEMNFYAAYSNYFDKFVENQIPKLGELLHLAIADHLRYNDRVRRVNQLPSKDLIEEESQRALKEFNNMMEIRGGEFTPLCDLVIKHFDAKFKKILFCALFHRILKHASTINPAIEGNIMAARTVISIMFKKCQCKDKFILQILENKEFEKYMTRILQLVEKCIHRKDDHGFDCKKAL